MEQKLEEETEKMRNDAASDCFHFIELLVDKEIIIGAGFNGFIIFDAEAIEKIAGISYAGKQLAIDVLELFLKKHLDCLDDDSNKTSTKVSYPPMVEGGESGVLEENSWRRDIAWFIVDSCANGVNWDLRLTFEIGYGAKRCSLRRHNQQFLGGKTVCVWEIVEEEDNPKFFSINA